MKIEKTLGKYLKEKMENFYKGFLNLCILCSEMDKERAQKTDVKNPLEKRFTKEAWEFLRKTCGEKVEEVAKYLRSGS